MQNWKSLKNRIQESVSLSLVLINQNDRMPLLPREELVPYKHCKNLTELPVGSIQQPWHQRTNLCPHRDEERKMTGTWCTEELKMAVQKGYKIMVLGALPNCRKQWKRGSKYRKSIKSGTGERTKERLVCLHLM